MYFLHVWKVSVHSEFCIYIYFFGNEMHFLLINSITEEVWTQISVKNDQDTIYRYFFRKKYIQGYFSFCLESTQDF